MGKSLNGKELGIGISQRKNGLYQARFTNQLGKRETIYSTSLTELRKNLRQEQVNNDHNIFKPYKRIRLDDWFVEWKNIFKNNCRNTTLNQYGVIYKNISKEIGNMYIDELTPFILQRVINNLKSDAQRKSTKKLLSNILNKAMYANLIPNNPAKHINTKIDKERTEEPRVLTKEEQQLLLSYSKNTCIYDFIVVALGTGMRQGEIRGLQKEDVDFDKNCIHVRHTLCYADGFELHRPKTDAGERLIPMTPSVKEALINQLNKSIIPKAEYKQYVFLNRQGQPMYPTRIKVSMDNIVKRIRKEYPYFKDITPHTLRHTFATRAIEKNMSPKVLQKILGHSKISITMDLYCHVTNNTLYEAMEIFD